jgi:hypothetical protein
MLGWIAISMEKYATLPETGKDSYENGLGDVDCIVYEFSSALPSWKAPIKE